MHSPKFLKSPTSAFQNLAHQVFAVRPRTRLDRGDRLTQFSERALHQGFEISAAEFSERGIAIGAVQALLDGGKIAEHGAVPTLAGSNSLIALRRHRAIIATRLAGCACSRQARGLLRDLQLRIERGLCRFDKRQLRNEDHAAQ